MASLYLAKASSRAGMPISRSTSHLELGELTFTIVFWHLIGMVKWSSPHDKVRAQCHRIDPVRMFR
jgi:hypothetical protein